MHWKFLIWNVRNNWFESDLWWLLSKSLLTKISWVISFPLFFNNHNLWLILNWSKVKLNGCAPVGITAQ